jgi:hypothetical protein
MRLVIALFPLPVVMVEAKDVRVAVLFAWGGTLGEPVLLTCGGILGEAVVPRRDKGGLGLWFDACDELRDVEGLTVGDSLGLLGRRAKSRGPAVLIALAPKTAGSVGFVRALWRGGVFGRCAEAVRGVDPGTVAVSARLIGTLCFDAANARGAGVGEIDVNVFDSNLSSSLIS